MASRYPNGIQDLELKGVPIELAHSGKVFYVNNSTVLAPGGIGGSDGNPGTFKKPFSTLEYAISKCTANRGDVIYLMPGHVETVSAADAIDFDVAGISVIGLGKGAKMARLDYTAGAGEVAIGADDILLENINFHANVDSVLIAVDVENGVNEAVIRKCRFDVETAGTDEFDNAIRFTNNNANCIVEDCEFDMGIADAVRAIFLDADTQNLKIRNNIIRGDYSTACIGGDTTLSTDLLIENNLLINGEAGDIGTVECIELLTGTHGVIRDNHLVCNVATPDLAIVADTCFQFNNYYSETVNAEAVLVNERPLTDSANSILGVDDSNNAFASTNVTANADGSIIERLEYVQAAVDDIQDNVPRGFANTSVALTGGDVADVFTVSNGPILVHQLVVQITTAVSANACLIHFESDPTTGASNTDIAEGTLAPDLQSAAVGDMFALDGDSQDVMVKYANGTDLPMMQQSNGSGIVVPEGGIDLKLSTSDPTTGIADIFIVYSPMAATAVVS